MSALARKAVKATALLFPLLGIPHLLFCINPKDNGTLEEAYMVVNAFVKSSQGLFVSVLYCFMNADVQMALRKAYMRSMTQRNPNYRSNCRRGLSQTSGTYISSQSEVSCHMDASRKKRTPSRAVLRLHEMSTNHENKSRVERMTVIF